MILTVHRKNTFELFQTSRFLPFDEKMPKDSPENHALDVPDPLNPDWNITFKKGRKISLGNTSVSVIKYHFFRTMRNIPVTRIDL